MAFLSPVIGATVRPYMSFANRVHWYVIWIAAHPHQNIHFKHEAIGNGFISEAHQPL